MIDVNGYLHLGTDIGLLTNKTILGVEDKISNKSSDGISPNPASDFISIKLPAELGMAGSLTYEVYSVMGEKMLETDSPERIDVSGLMPGVYFVKAGERTFKFVKI